MCESIYESDYEFLKFFELGDNSLNEKTHYLNKMKIASFKFT